MDGPVEWLPPDEEPGAFTGAPVPSGEVEAVTSGRPDSAAALAWERLDDRVRAIPARTRFGALAVVAAAAGVAAGFLLTTGDTARPRAEQRGSTDPAQAATSVLVSKALQPASLGDVIRPTAQPGCALVPLGRSPGRAAATALSRVLPTYRLRDVGRILDQSTGLCTLDLRAADAAGSVVLIEVVPPGTHRPRSYPQVTVSTLSDGSISSSIAATVSVDGWSIAVVAVGRLADQPDVAAMLSLTDDTSLRW